jgi:hypothetical protein
MVHGKRQCRCRLTAPGCSALFAAPPLAELLGAWRLTASRNVSRPADESQALSLSPRFLTAGRSPSTRMKAFRSPQGGPLMAPRFIENGAGQRGSARKSETRLAESPRDLQVNADLRGPVRKADDGSRTRDLRLGKPTLYQLSYVRARAESYPPDITEWSTNGPRAWFTRRQLPAERSPTRFAPPGSALLRSAPRPA